MAPRTSVASLLRLAAAFIVMWHASAPDNVVAQQPDRTAIQVVASAKVLALAKRLSSEDLPVLKWSSPLGFSDIVTNTTAKVLDPKFSWESEAPAPPFRLMFFTSAADPLKDLSQLDPSADGRQLAFYDGRIAPHVLHFLAVAGLAPAAEKRSEFAFRLRAGGGSPLFCQTGCLRLFVTYSGLEEDVRKLGGVPVTFVAR
jgi:hypothetical protein